MVKTESSLKTSSDVYCLVLSATENRFCTRPPYVKRLQNEEALIHCELAHSTVFFIHISQMSDICGWTKWYSKPVYRKKFSNVTLYGADSSYWSIIGNVNTSSNKHVQNLGEHMVPFTKTRSTHEGSAHASISTTQGYRKWA